MIKGRKERRLSEFLSVQDLEEIQRRSFRSMGLPLCILGKEPDMILPSRPLHKLCKLFRSLEMGKERCRNEYLSLAADTYKHRQPLFRRCYAGLMMYSYPLWLRDEILGILAFSQVAPPQDQKGIEDRYQRLLGLPQSTKEFSGSASTDKGFLMTEEQLIEAADLIGRMLEALIYKEFELKDLAAQIVANYEEINLLCQLIETSRDRNSLGKLTNQLLPEVMKLIRANKGALILKGRSRGITSTRQKVMLDKMELLLEEFGFGCSGACSPKSSVLPEEIPLQRPMEGPPAVSIPLECRGKIMGTIHVNGRAIKEPFSTEDLKLLAALGHSIASAIENDRLSRRVHELSLGTVRALASAIEAKDPYTQGHSCRVTRYALMIAGNMGLEHREREAVRMAGLMHDIGKIGISGAILRKRGVLSDEEYDEMKRHPMLGYRILKHANISRRCLEGVRNHHERYDGNGYPDRLSGRKIPMVGRIIAVADAFDAMTSDRPHRTGLSSRDAMRELEREAGCQFDPAIVEVFLKAIDA